MVPLVDESSRWTPRDREVEAQTIGGNELVDFPRNFRFGVVTDFGTDFDQPLVSYGVVLGRPGAAPLRGNE